MLPKKTTNQGLQLFELSENPLIRNRQLMLQVPEVKSKLSKIESLVTESSTKMMFREVPQAKRMDLVASIVENTCKDLGIVKWNTDKEKTQYTLTRFMQVIDRYYSDLSFSSIKLAFELLATGNLDEYLPKDKNGNPDKNHYGEFSFEFYSRILNAFKKKNSDVWAKVRLSLPKVQVQISDEEKKHLSNEIINDIFISFDAYKTKQTIPNFDLEVHINILIENKLVEKLPFQEENVKKAYNRLLISNHISKLDKKKLIDNYDKKVLTDGLKLEAQRIENNLTIKKYFDSLIEQKKDIRDFLKQIQ